jgi:hypothetical protein
MLGRVEQAATGRLADAVVVVTPLLRYNIRVS